MIELGQQQLLLIVLGLIIVGVAIVVGINLFTANAVEAKRNSLTIELLHMASLAQQYYKTPIAYGGGSRAFTDWEIPQPLVSTATGRYEATVQAQQVLLRGIGNEVVTGNDSVEIQMTVFPNDYSTVIIH